MLTLIEARSILTQAARKAEQALLAEAQGTQFQSSINQDALAALMALAIYTAAIVEHGSIEAWGQAPYKSLFLSMHDMLKTCTFLADSPEYEPSSAWPWTKQQMSEAYHRQERGV